MHKCDGCKHKGVYNEPKFQEQPICRKAKDIIEATIAFNAEKCPFMNEKLQIIDFERKGNLVRFYLGKNGKQWGDDWNDAPYEHNAESVYDNYIKGKRDIAFPFDFMVLEPKDGVSNSRYSKADMIKRHVPCIIVVPPALAKDSAGYDFYDWIASDCVKKYYFGDEMESDENA